ncbi:MAG: extracellular solute-binding protein [Planctomycetota bacterium]
MTNLRLSKGVSYVVYILLLVIIAAFLFFSYYLFWRGGEKPLVVYCAHDSVYSESILKEFEKRTGIPVSIRFDTEATKSLGLTELLISEKENPRCDVFWNNQLMGTLRLKKERILLPYKGSGFERVPDSFKDSEGYWTGFAARFRVYIINTEKFQPTEEAVEKALAKDLSYVAIAKPLYGTTLTHYTVLWHLWGAEKLKNWHNDWRTRGIKEVQGNATVKNLVAQGVCYLGLTDTDDFFVAKDEGKPVAMLPCKLENGSTICIPNTVCIIKGTKKISEAQQLVDFLLSAECELSLANSKSRQIPLGNMDEAKLSKEVREMKKWVSSAYPISSLEKEWQACLDWLKSEYLK